jgi:hypothetical protein
MKSKICFLIDSFLLGEEDDGVLKSHRSTQGVCGGGGGGGRAHSAPFSMFLRLFLLCVGRCSGS